MDNYPGSEFDYIRRAVLKHWPEKELVFISEIFKDGKVFSAFEPEFKYFLIKIRTPSDNKYHKHSGQSGNIERYSIPAYQMSHVCKILKKKGLNFVVLDKDESTGRNFGKFKVIRSNRQEDCESLLRF